jgi:predicted outer membrane repeat protein
MIIWLLCASLLSHCHGVSAASVISIYVSPFDPSPSLPCGTIVSSPCPSITAAFQSIPFLSNSSLDNVNILLYPTVHITCDVSYYSLVTNVRNNTALNVSIQSMNQSFATLMCTNTSYSRVLGLDADGLNVKMMNVNVSVTFGKIGVQFSASYGKNIYVSFNCTNCTFYGNSTAGIGIALLDAYQTSKISVQLYITSCIFQFLNYGVYIRDEEVANTVALKTGLPCLVQIQDSSIVSTLRGMTIGSNVYSIVKYSNFTGNVRAHFGQNEFANSSFQFCQFTNSTATLTLASSYSSFIGCLFDRINQISLQFQYIYTFQDCVFQNSYAPLGLIYTSPRSGNVAMIFMNITFSNISSSSSAPSVFLNGLAHNLTFRNCYFLASSRNARLFLFPSQENKVKVTLFESCHFSTYELSNYPVIQAMQDTFPNSSVSFKSCVFENISLSSPSGMITVTSSGSFLISNCQFTNISNSAMGIILLSRARSFVITGCQFEDLNGTVLFISFSQQYQAISNCSLRNIYSPLQGLILLKSAKNVSILSSNFSTIYGSVVLDRESVVLIQDCKFTNFVSKPVLSMFVRSVLNASGLVMDGSIGINGGCISSAENVTIAFSRSAFNNCVSVKYGGAIFLGKLSNFTCSDCLFTRNFAKMSGGAIFSTNSSTMNLMNTSFTSNTASENGGAIFQLGTGFFQSTVFMNNSAFLDGGGFFASLTIVSLFNVTFKSNTAARGGGLYLSQLPPFSIDVFVTSNSAKNTSFLSCSDSFGSGGGLFVEFLNMSNPIPLSSWNIVHNEASLFGGGIAVGYLEGYGSLSDYADVSFDNTAQYGNDIGTLWSSIEVRNSFGDSALYFGDEIQFGLTFRDDLNQSAQGFTCDMFLNVLSSNPDFGLIPDRNRFAIQTSIGVVSLNFSLIPIDISNVPSPNQSSLILFEVSTQSKSAQTSIVFSVCPPAYQTLVQSNGWVICIPCQRGTFLYFPSVGAAFCKECDRGRYSDGTQSSCLQCSPGSVSSIFGSESCSLCSPGGFADSSGKSACQICSSGSFSFSSGSTFCQKCPASSSTVNQGSVSTFSCVCPEGTYGQPWKGLDCKSCPVREGSSCSLNSSVPFVFPGYWRSLTFPEETFQCIPQIACNQTGVELKTSCSIGYSGNRCGECIKGVYFHFDIYCKKCGETAVSGGAVFAAIFLLLLLTTKIIASRMNTSIRRRVDFTALISALQFLALYPRIGNNWPPRMKYILDVLSVYVSFCFSGDFQTTSYV